MHIQPHQARGGLKSLTGMHTHPYPDALPADHACDSSDCCIWIAAARHAVGEEKTAKNPSP